jgi:hypothetical protein
MPNPTNGTPGLAAVRADLEDLALETGRSIFETDEHTSDTLTMVAALEEVMFAPWWRRPLVRARWRRDVAASIRHIQGASFTERRVNTIATGWITRPEPRHNLIVVPQPRPRWTGPAR